MYPVSERGCYIYALSPRRDPFPLSLPAFSMSSRDGPALDKPSMQDRKVTEGDGEEAGGGGKAIHQRWEPCVLGTWRRSYLSLRERCWGNT